MLTARGTNIRYSRDPASGKLTPQWQGGNFAFADDMTEVVMSLLLEEEGWSTANRRRGPGLLSVRLDTADTPSQLRARAEQRLELAIQDGRLRSVEITVEQVRRGSYNVGVSFVSRSGRRDLVTVSLGN